MNGAATPLSQRLRQHWNPVLDRLIGVIDLMNGVAVHGIAGKRTQYLPIAELPVDECSLLKWYRSIGIRRFYVADLDGLMGNGRQCEALLRLATELCAGETLWIDCGWSGAVLQVDRDWLAQMQSAILPDASLRWIIATESADSMAVLDRMLNIVPESRLTLSLDFRCGEFVGAESALKWLEAARGRNIVETILLDVASVGSQSGPGNDGAFSDLVSKFDDLKWITGGGIRHAEDVQNLVAEGYSAILVASALLPKWGVGSTAKN
ncbi:HisA/HisF-related TIM barrel protein [Rhodopirellula bahusiensis]|uniref:HisA/HisF-related TIM barrel protein n=1 Tax=Rhodopirellula bahusiensis TaxID=2014065 RepID=UPI0032641862